MTGNTPRTIWSRLEPRPRSDTMEDGLRAPVRDPMWLLSRQWQLQEFRGEDAGSPVQADVEVDHDRVTRVDLRGGGPAGDLGPFDYDGGPLEATVERERVMTGDDQPGARRRAEAGQHFLRLLGEEGESLTVGDFPANLRLDGPDEAMEPADRRYVETVADRTLDGRAVFDAIQDGTLSPPAAVSSTSAFNDAAAAYESWYADLYDEPTATSGSAWQPRRLEYRFAVSTGEADTETVLEADEHRGDSLEWYDFSTADAGESLSPPPNPTPDGTTTTGKTVLPTRVTFPGMPATRWWECEDRDVGIDRLAADGSSLQRLLFTAFAVHYGNDWFRIPLETPVGTLSRVTALSVTDTFGLTEEATAALDSEWQLFMHELPTHDEPGLFLPPTRPDPLESDPVERVLLGRDEVANLTFGLERLVEGPTDRARDRTEFNRPRVVIDTIAPSTDASAEYIELTNPGDDELDVLGYTLERTADDGTTTTVYTFGAEVLDPGEIRRLTTAELSVGASAWDGAAEVSVYDADGDLVAVQLLGTPPHTLPDYRLSTDVPDYWFPFTMEHDAGEYWFERALLLDAESLDLPLDQLPKPRGSILDPPDDLLPANQDTFRLFEEEVGQSGRDVTRRYQLARWYDGSVHLWSSRRSSTGRTDLVSNVSFDFLDEESTQL